MTAASQSPRSASFREPWFVVPARTLRFRADPGFVAAAREVDEWYQHAAFPLVKLGELATEVQYGTSARPKTKGQTQIVRMNNLSTHGLDLTDRKWVDLPENEVAKYRLMRGDILFNRTNSKELVGKTAVFDEDGEWVFASYLIRVRVSTERVLPEFVSEFLNSEAGRLQIDRDSRQIVGMANVNATELRELVMPLPPLDVQTQLLAELLDARRDLAKAKIRLDSADATVDELLVQMLGVKIADPTTTQTFSVPVRALRSSRLDPSAHVPSVRTTDDTSIRRLGEIAEVNPRRERPREADGLVPYIGLPDCELRRVREVNLRPATDPIGRSVVMIGDILFARIEPSVFNRKYVRVQDLFGFDRVLTSGEFYVVQGNSEAIDQSYLHEVLLSSIVAAQIRGKTTGSSGRRRLDRATFEAIAVPVPDFSEQRRIVSALQEVRLAAEGDAEKAESRITAELERIQNRLFPQP